MIKENGMTPRQKWLAEQAAERKAKIARKEARTMKKHMRTLALAGLLEECVKEDNFEMFQRLLLSAKL
jgi:hypothetical protein